MNQLFIGILIGIVITILGISLVLFLSCLSGDKNETYEEYRERMYPPGM